MSKQYWNGVLNRLPNFLDKMGKSFMQTATMQYAMKRSGCCRFNGMYASIFGGYPGMFGNYSGMYGNYTSSISGLGGSRGSYWDNQGMYQSIYGNYSGNNGSSISDNEFQAGLEQILQESQQQNPLAANSKYNTK